ncbi:MAG: helix-turn-helix domain-containing protein [Paracoccaceae bacterium]
MKEDDTMKKTSERNHDWCRADAMTDAEIEAAALSDPDAQPLTVEKLKGMKQTSRVKMIRRALGLSQDEFAARYQIPVGTLRDWEQNRTTPDQAALAYLTVIARDPEFVRTALASN